MKALRAWLGNEVCNQNRWSTGGDVESFNFVAPIFCRLFHTLLLSFATPRLLRIAMGLQTREILHQ